MSNALQTYLYNTQPEATQELCDQLGSINFTRFMGEVNDPEELAVLLQQSDVNLVFFHLDPRPAAVIEVIEQVSTRYPALALIALSHKTGPEAILAPIRAGCDQFVCEPIDAEDLAAAVGRVVKKRLMNRTKSRCICVVGASGGMGTTSIACNLALELAQLTGSSCALADMNFQFGDTAVNFDAEPKYTCFDLAESGADLDRTMLVESMTNLACNVALLARPQDVDQASAMTPDAVHRIVELLNTAYESVVIDLPRTIDAVSLAALAQADVVLIVCQLFIPNIRNTKRYFDALLQADIPEDRIEVIINRLTKSAGRVSVKDVEQKIGKELFAEIPNDFEFIARSLDFGRPIAALDQTNPVRSAIREMAKKIVGSDDDNGKVKPVKKGFLGRLLSRSAST